VACGFTCSDADLRENLPESAEFFSDIAFLRMHVSARRVRDDRVADVGRQARFELLVVRREPRVADVYLAERMDFKLRPHVT
jgi:hypothetical protein